MLDGRLGRCGKGHPQFLGALPAATLGTGLRSVLAFSAVAEDSYFSWQWHIQLDMVSGAPQNKNPPSGRFWERSLEQGGLRMGGGVPQPFLMPSAQQVVAGGHRMSAVGKGPVRPHCSTGGAFGPWLGASTKLHLHQAAPALPAWRPQPRKASCKHGVPKGWRKDGEQWVGKGHSTASGREWLGVDMGCQLWSR